MPSKELFFRFPLPIRRCRRLPTPRHSSRWVISSWIPWMAAEYSPYCLPRATENPPLFNRLNRILAAGRNKATLGTQKGADSPLVKPNRPNRQADGNIPHRRSARHHLGALGSLVLLSVHDDDSSLPEASFARRALRSVSRCSDETIRKKSGSAPRRGRMTQSMPGGNLSRFCRNASRISRFHRFRWTAFPVFLGMLIPTRPRDTWQRKRDTWPEKALLGRGFLDGRALTTKSWSETIFPFPMI